MTTAEIPTTTVLPAYELKGGDRIELMPGTVVEVADCRPFGQWAYVQYYGLHGVTTARLRLEADVVVVWGE